MQDLPGDMNLSARWESYVKSLQSLLDKEPTQAEVSS
jgi:hypothetical protein